MRTEDIIKSLRTGIDTLEYNYNMRPNRIILGTKIVSLLTKGVFVAHQDHEDEPNTILGIPFDVDYINPYRIATCIEFEIFPEVSSEEDL